MSEDIRDDDVDGPADGGTLVPFPQPATPREIVITVHIP